MRPTRIRASMAHAPWASTFSGIDVELQDFRTRVDESRDTEQDVTKRRLRLPRARRGSRAAAALRATR